ncbi:hypothetical protein HPNQ4053_0862 [Helicobacter pylori NQ4053]|uniref:Uncharacterized protein n=1 Tax=Helicobacter pylori NQ4053 TaxID=992027 RepID=J0J785_HELPX|nr:hypothetical protein HPNQ4053_0862 [Helicobacter pylori NQ4053]
MKPLFLNSLFNGFLFKFSFLRDFFFKLSFFGGFDLFLFADPHCFRFLIFEFFGDFDEKSFLAFLVII